MRQALSSWWTFFAVACVIVGVFLRLQFFGSVPGSLYWDEMALWSEAQSIAQTAKDTNNRPWNQLIFLSYGDYKMPMYIWLTAPFARFIEEPNVGARIISLLSGLSLLGTLPWLASELYRFFRLENISELSRRNLVISTLWVAAFAPVLLHFSRVGFEAHLALALVVAALAFLFRGFLVRSHGFSLMYFLLSALFAVAATYAYFSVRYVWPGMFLSTLGIFILGSQINRSKILRSALALLAGVFWLVLLIPFTRSDFYVESQRFRLGTPSILNSSPAVETLNQWRLDSGNTILSRFVFSSKIWQAQALSRNMMEFLNPGYIFVDGDENLRHGTGETGLFWWWSMPFLVIGFFALWRKSPRAAAVLSIWWAFGVLPAAVPNDVPHALRSLNALPSLILFLATGLSVSTEFIRRKPGVLSLIFVGVLITLTLWSSVFWMRLQPGYAEASKAQWQNGYRELAEYLTHTQASHLPVQVFPFDDRFFVYYQVFSQESWNHIQLIPTQGFKRDTFGYVQLQLPSALDDAQSGTFVIVPVGKEVPERFTEKERIRDAFGEEQFVVVQAIRE